MSKKITFTDDAKADIQEAYDYYEGKKVNLGEEFLDELDETVSNISSNPKMYAIFYKYVRRAVLNRFPYAILYVIQQIGVNIFAVFSTYQDDKKFLDRDEAKNGENETKT